jgi:hypothetical protein
MSCLFLKKNSCIKYSSKTISCPVPLIKESPNVNKSLHDEGFYTWYTLALNVFQEFDLDAEDFST